MVVVGLIDFGGYTPASPNYTLWTYRYLQKYHYLQTFLAVLNNQNQLVDGPFGLTEDGLTWIFVD